MTDDDGTVMHVAKGPGGIMAETFDGPYRHACLRWDDDRVDFGVMFDPADEDGHRYLHIGLIVATIHVEWAPAPMSPPRRWARAKLTDLRARRDARRLVAQAEETLRAEADR